MSDKANEFDGGFTMKNTGGAHVTVDQGEAHSTTAVPGLKQGGTVNVRVDIDADGNVEDPSFTYNQGQ
jgi:hypothetical protein